MSKEDLDLREEDREESQSSPQEGSDSEDAQLDDLFEDESSEESQDSKEESEKSKDDEIAQLKKTVESLEKGFKKAFSEKGRESEKEGEQNEVKDEPKTNSILKSLYLKSNPEAQEVWDEVEKEAKSLNKDPFELYESSSYFKGEAKARAEAKRVEEESKQKIAKPSTNVDFAKKDPSKLTPEEVNKLSASDALKYMEAMAERERRGVE